MPTRPAPEQFSHDGFIFTQVWREGMTAIYDQRRPGDSCPTSFEVVKLRVRKAHPKDHDQSPKEGYPSSNEWGVRGWSCLDLPQAMGLAARLTP